MSTAPHEPSWRLSSVGRLLRRSRRAPVAARLALGGLSAKQVTVRDDGFDYRFRCTTFDEYRRATSLFYKEPGTYRWLVGELRSGDVFYDIGANIGVFSILGGHRVGRSGRVVAFEPHVENAGALLRNVELNGLDNVRVLSVALAAAAGFFDFEYGRLDAGSALSQLRERGSGSARTPGELKYATSIDELIESANVDRPDVVKLDIDGNELAVLSGMAKTLEGESRPRAVQVELAPETRDRLVELMSSHGYELVQTHASEGVERMIERGADASAHPVNGIFRLN